MTIDVSNQLTDLVARFKDLHGVDLSNSEELRAAIFSIQRDYCRKYFYVFVRQAWQHVYGHELVDNWHIAAMCYHLQALWEGNLFNERGEPVRVLVFNIPPETAKSSVSCALFSTWVWLQDPTAGQWYASFGQDLCVRDSMDARRLITSPWYRLLWGDSFGIAEDQNQKQLYYNTRGGWRLAVSMGSKVGFGRHPKIIGVDDPLSPKRMETADRLSAIEYWRSTLATRGVGSGVRKFIGAQRLHEEDLSGYVLSTDTELVHLVLPMEFEPDRKCVTRIRYRDVDDIGEDGMPKLKERWEDPRTKHGELLFPKRMDEKVIATLKRGLVFNHRIAGQLQQRPTSPEGDFFEASWFSPILPKPSESERAVRAWDKASSTGTKSDYTAGALLVDVDRYNVDLADMKRGKWARKKRDEIILRTAIRDAEKYADYTIILEQEGSGGGKDAAAIAAEDLQREGFRVRIVRPTAKKEVRWEGLAGGLASGRARLVKGKWNAAFLEEALAAPNGRHDDQIDAFTMGYNYLVKKMTRNRVNRPLLLLTPEEEQELDEESKRFCLFCGGDGCPECRDPNELVSVFDMACVDEGDELGVRW